MNKAGVPFVREKHLVDGLVEKVLILDDLFWSCLPTLCSINTVWSHLVQMTSLKKTSLILVGLLEDLLVI